MHVDKKYLDQTPALNIEPEIHAITPQLLQAEKEQRAQQENHSLDHFLESANYPYRISAGDVLSIVAWDHPELSTTALMNVQSAPATTTDRSSSSIVPTGFVVDHNGMVQFAYVGAIKLAGLTELQARDALIQRLARYLKNPDLSVRVQAYRSQRVYVDGEVKMPGSQVINDIPMTLMEALNRAGGILPSGDQSQVNINRAGKKYRVNIPRLLEKGIDPNKIMLRHDDIVHVLNRDESQVFVMGEVIRPMPLSMHNGRMTLNEALGAVGGLNPFGAEGQQVYVVRSRKSASPLIYNLDARSPAALAMAENFDLNPKDVVFVDASRLAIWNRVISLILPSAQSAISAAVLAK